MTQESRIAITGATGYVGQFVVPELVSAGYNLRALSRSGSARQIFSQPIEWIEGDLQSAAAFSRLVSGASAVIHLAYEHVPGRYRGGEGSDLAAWLDANVNGSLRLLLAARDAGVKTFIFLSSRAVFSRTEPGRELDETHPPSPDTHYGAYKLAVEAFLRSFAHVEGMRTYSLRATGVYGLIQPVERSKWWPLVKTIVEGRDATSSGGGTEVHGRDVARVIHKLIDSPPPDFDVVHLSDLLVTHREVVRLARQFAKRPGPLPDTPAAPPTNPLVCRNLPRLGISLGGVPLLEATIEELVRAARN